MTISPPEREVKAVKIVVDRDPVPTSFEKWGNPDTSHEHLQRSFDNNMGMGSPC